VNCYLAFLKAEALPLFFLKKNKPCQYGEIRIYIFIAIENVSNLLIEDVPEIYYQESHHNQNLQLLLGVLLIF